MSMTGIDTVWCRVYTVNQTGTKQQSKQGVTDVKAAWDGTIAAAVDECIERLKCYADDYRKVMQPCDDWITVTVDYHS